MVLSYFIVCPMGSRRRRQDCRLTSFPALDSMELYRIAGRPVYLAPPAHRARTHGIITCSNYRGVRLSATFQNWTAFGTLALFVVFVRGSRQGFAANFPPLFTHGGFVSVLLVMQIVPYFMTGYESVGKAAEEASPEFRDAGISQGDLDGDHRGHSLLHRRDRRRGLCRALEESDGREVHDCSGI